MKRKSTIIIAASIIILLLVFLWSSFFVLNKSASSNELSCDKLGGVYGKKYGLEYCLSETKDGLEFESYNHVQVSQDKLDEILRSATEELNRKDCDSLGGKYRNINGSDYCIYSVNE